MYTSVFDVCEYLNNRYLDLERSFPTEDLQTEIDKLSMFVSRLKEAYKTSFEGMDIKNDELFTSNDVSEQFGLAPAKLISYALMIQFDPEAPMAQYKQAHEDIKELIFNINLELRDKRKQLNESKNSIEKENLERILKIFKNGDGAQIKLSGNVSLEDYDYIIELLSESNIPLDVINEFLSELNDAIADYKFKYEKLSAVIEKDSRKEEFEKLAGGSLNDINPEDAARLLSGLPTKTPDYNYKRIYRVLDYLERNYSPITDNPPINEKTPYDSDRTRLYYTINSDGSTTYNRSVILYDLLHFINPKTLNERFLKGELKSNEFNDIKNVIYKDIISKLKEEMRKEMVEEVPEPPTPEKIQEAFEEMAREQELEPEYINENIKELDEEQSAKVDYAKVIVHDIKKEFAFITQYPVGYLRECLNSDESNVNQYDKSILSLAVDYIPKFEEMLKKYEKTYFELKTNKEFSGPEYLEFLENDTDDLLTAATKLIRRFEEYKSEKEIEVEEFSPDINNIIMLYHVYPTGETPIPDDIDTAVAKGAVTKEFIYDGLGRMEYMSTIVNGKHVTKIKTGKHNLDDIRVYKYRQGAMRYIYTNITIDDSNKEVIKEKYGLQTDNLRLLLVPYIFYKHGNKEEYEVALSRIESIKGIDENQVGSILWIKSIFGNKFTEETMKIAFELIDNSLAIKNSIVKGGGNLGSY